jgi:hypothetical protein
MTVKWKQAPERLLPVKITTRATYASIDDFINGANPIIWEGFEYKGPVADLKKGRNDLQGATTAGRTNIGTAADITKQDRGVQGGYRTAGDQIANSEVNTNGGLSPLVAKQLANEQGLIGKTYAGASRAAERGLTMRGMGSAPTGLQSSIDNTAINNSGVAQTGAVGNAFGTQNELNNGVLNYDVGQQKLYDPLRAIQAGNESIGATTGAGSALNKAGSTLGDIGTGIGTLLGAANGVKGLGGFSGIGKSVMNG